jgi:hypothetical protein
MTLRNRQAADPKGLWMSRLEESELIYRARLEHLVDVREPLVLISQVQRSGGTLLNRLLQGHPECHGHAHELKIGGHSQHRNWPTLALEAPDEWFSILYETHLSRHLREGYQKWYQRDGGEETFAFCFAPGLQKAIFERCVASRPIERQRDVLDCYFTSYFNAWLDNHNLYTGPKKTVVAFAPRTMMSLDNLERFFSDYPDGTLISIVRDPTGWYDSMRRRHPEQFEELDEAALALWRRSTEAALDAADRWGNSVVVLTYERLVLETAETMRRLADRIGLSMSPVLLTPTFNGRPIRANSSARVEGHGILAERTTAYRSSLDRETIARVEELNGDLYERASALGRRL